ncbi:MAG TPA: sugar nucleotide-binding protein [Herpetosiphonaceae bacterium]|nr:sugar nucleotide-binding protein [Herpetosiphonaceae bacterium]
MSTHDSGRVAVWGGLECTVNRVGDAYFDQIARSGHAGRPGDLDQIAALGLTTLRYPLLWERHASPQIDWSWADERMGRLRALGIAPIVGLVHHGSGPPTTSLIDPRFPELLADFAGAVAERYPWIEHYAPINEPLTTARFSGLYGHWYPHGRDDATFARILITQCRAAALAMRAIRAVVPGARLVQTEDVGRTWSTPPLAYQAAFENERRWLTFDLLCGRVGPAHPMWAYLRSAGLAEAEILWFASNPCPPDILGINYYVTSERFLDDRLDPYPAHTHGGNHRDRYADIEAVRVRAEGIAGSRFILAEAWERYRLPLAVTEVQLAATREEQLRWMHGAWQAAQDLRRAGVDVRAVTAWALLGAYDWDSLVTCANQHYEPGAFDVRGPRPRPTAVAHLLGNLARGRPPAHPWLTLPGWWQRPERLVYGVAVDDSGSRVPADLSVPALLRGEPDNPLLITGGGGVLGQAFARICAVRGIPCRVLSRQELDIARPAAVQAALAEIKPWAVINAAGYTKVDQAEGEAGACFRANSVGAAVLAAACAASGVGLVGFSSDLVFDGEQAVPYLESDRPAPLNIYGRSKALAEQRIRAIMPGALIIRSSAIFGPWDEANFVSSVIATLARSERVVAPDDWQVSPTYLPDLVQATLDLLLDGETGIWHLANQGGMTWATLARQVASMSGLDAAGIEGRPRARLDWPARRPGYSVLGSERGQLLPALDTALARYLPACALVGRLPQKYVVGNPGCWSGA